MDSRHDWTILEKFKAVASQSRTGPIRGVKAAIDFKSKLSIEHKGQIVRRLFTLSLPGGKPSCLGISVKHANARWLQGLHIETSKGLLEYGSSGKAKGMRLWVGLSEEPWTIKCTADCREVRIWNVWDTGSGTVNSLMDCAGVVANGKPDGTWELRFNDGYPDDDFSDLVVELEIRDG